MGNFSRNTFDQLKHYVGVRLQQGVPLVDADWNEQEDIRKHELQSFLKWFVGNGVPKGNDGFRIIPHAGGAENDFTIKGGMENEPGYCLVEGWDAMIEQDIDYTQQPLFNNETLAQAWGVEPLVPLSPPSSGERSDTVYLDIWEREVDAQDDDNLVNPAIGIETCVRLKREWVVRVSEGVTTPPAPAQGHVYYPLASLKRSANQNTIGPDDITDLRRTGLSVLSEAITIKDGNVGIGETNPIDRLVVGGAIDPVIRMTSTDGSTGFIQTLQKNGGLRLYDGKDYTMHWKNGNVGIDTNEPEATLHIRGNALFEGGSGTFSLYGGVDRVEYNGYLQLLNSVKSANAWGLKAGGVLVSDDYSYANPGKNGLIVKGKVGIGTQEPKTELDVNGDINVTGGLAARGGQVRRDFLTWNTTVGSSQPIHIKTNIPRKSCVMFRFLVEGYNYGLSAAICSDVVGYTYVEPDDIINTQTNNYANGVTISQYYSSDGYVVIKLTTNSTYFIGFSVSAWFTNPTGTAFDISASVVQQADDL